MTKVLTLPTISVVLARVVLAPVVLAMIVSVSFPQPAQANRIERACLQSDSEVASRALCACIGEVADRTLDRLQMREGARFFRDPQRAQDVRQSDRRSDAAMWRAWRNFGDTAEAMCS